jgi:hypothetical protein
MQFTVLALYNRAGHKCVPVLARRLIFAPFKAVVLNLFIGGDTHFDNENLATQIEYAYNYKQMSNNTHLKLKEKVWNYLTTHLKKHHG